MGSVRVLDVLGGGEAGSHVRSGLAHCSCSLHEERDAAYSGGRLQGLLGVVVELVVAHAAVVGAAPRSANGERHTDRPPIRHEDMPARTWAMHRRAARRVRRRCAVCAHCVGRRGAGGLGCDKDERGCSRSEAEKACF